MSIKPSLRPITVTPEEEATLSQAVAVLEAIRARYQAANRPVRDEWDSRLAIHLCHFGYNNDGFEFRVSPAFNAGSREGKGPSMSVALQKMFDITPEQQLTHEIQKLTQKAREKRQELRKLRSH